MLDTATFFQSFDKAGFLKTALWTPSVGLPGAGVQQSAQVRYNATTREGFGGEVATTEYTIEYPAALLAGLKRGETLSIDSANYTVRESPVKQLDGSRLEAKLAKA